MDAGMKLSSSLANIGLGSIHCLAKEIGSCHLVASGSGSKKSRVVIITSFILEIVQKAMIQQRESLQF